MEIWCINLRKSLETIASLTFSNKLLTVLKAGYNLDTMRQTACLVFNPIRVTPVNPSFTIQKWGVSGSTLHGHVILMGFFLS